MYKLWWCLPVIISQVYGFGIYGNLGGQNEDSVMCKSRIQSTGKCPVGRKGCEENADCATDLICCDDGCGMSCHNTTTPTTPPAAAALPKKNNMPSPSSYQIVPSCPGPVYMMMQFCSHSTYLSCQAHTDCRNGMWCCPNVCGMRCRMPVMTPVQVPATQQQSPAIVPGTTNPYAPQPSIPTSPSYQLHQLAHQPHIASVSQPTVHSYQLPIAQQPPVSQPTVPSYQIHAASQPHVSYSSPNFYQPTTRTTPLYKGTCPHFSLVCSGPAKHYCSSDSHCYPHERCCQDRCTMMCARVSVTKSGFCPVPPSRTSVSLQCSYYNKCKDDGDCSGEMKCCRHPCGNMCLGPVTVKQGTCTNTQYSQCRSNMDLCSKDDDCRGLNKCCMSNCGNRCQPPGTPPKPGVCPHTDHVRCIRWQNGCTTDHTCYGNKKCCNTGCGNACLTPTSYLYSG